MFGVMIVIDARFKSCIRKGDHTTVSIYNGVEIELKASGIVIKRGLDSD